MKTIDMHTHTTSSDGSYTPVELVDYAVKKELSAIAITDHDTMEGIQEAIDYIREFQLPLELIPGIEISSYSPGYPFGLHILAYFINKEDNEIKEIKNSLYTDLSQGSVSPQKAIKITNKHGGIPVLAHPKDCFLSMTKLDNLIVELSSAGLKGIECIYTTHTNEEINQFKEIAFRHNMLITGGTDFHGLKKPDTELGSGYGNLTIPYDLLNSIKNKVMLQ